MLEIVRTLVLAPSQDIWRVFETNYSTFFAGRDEMFDRLIEVIREFFASHQMVPGYEALWGLLQGVNDRDLLSYVDRSCQDPGIPVFADPAAFYARLSVLKNQMAVVDVSTAYRDFSAALSTGTLHPEGVVTAIDGLLTRVHQSKAAFQEADSTIALKMHGEEAIARLEERYQKNKERRANDETIYFSFPFEYFNEVKFAAGDFITIVGYTSHCKSALARELCYHLLIHHQRNVGFWTFEMPAAEVEVIFAIRHANNKQIPGFQGTPKISYTAWKTGALSEEEEAFLFLAQRDLLTNEAYGSLFVEQPTNSSFNLADLALRISDVEHTFIPLHAVCVDYLSQMNPFAHGVRPTPGKEATNQMFAEFRKMLLTHCDQEGKVAPLIGISPAQISRGKFQEALKNEMLYDSDAPSDYNEIERSSVLMFAVLMTREMRDEGRLSIQCLKNRMGVVPVDRHEVFVDLPFGMGMAEFASAANDNLLGDVDDMDPFAWSEMVQQAVG